MTSLRMTGLQTRRVLLTTTAGICLATAGAAQAGETGPSGPQFAEDSAFSSAIAPAAIGTQSMATPVVARPDLDLMAVRDAAHTPEVAIETP